MVVPSAGEVVLVPFPFSDLSASKVRPAICLAAAGYGDFILCQVTSKDYGDAHAVALSASDFATGQLIVTSFARPGKIFTASSSLILRTVGTLTDSTFRRVQNAVIKLLSSP